MPQDNQVKGESAAWLDTKERYIASRAAFIVAAIYDATREAPQAVRAAMTPHEVDRAIAKTALALIDAR